MKSTLPLLIALVGCADTSTGRDPAHSDESDPIHSEDTDINEPRSCLAPPPSVALTITDLSGEPLTPDALVYSIDGAPFAAVDCTGLDCAEVSLGDNEAGTFLVEASIHEDDPTDADCWYEDVDFDEVLVQRDSSGCVVTESMDLVLDPGRRVCVKT